jgi:uncharacterized membrane protein YfcA
MHLELSQWLWGALAAILVGFSKTGIPGVGILVVPILAAAFGGRQSIGIMLPMLIFGDYFAVFWYRRNAQWDKLIGLLPWVVVGLAVGTVMLWQTGLSKSNKDVIGMVIGILVLVMLGLVVLQRILGDRLTPKSKSGAAVTGVTAGFSTMVSNAAGPIMSLYLAALDMPKDQFMGTIAWYFFIINLSKLPVYFILSHFIPQEPIVTKSSMLFNIEMLPVVIVGVFIGRWLLPRMSQKTFDTAILALAAAGALKLVIG